MVGATYLCYEGAEKVWAAMRGHEAHGEPSAVKGPEAEKEVVTGAIRTDFILSTEIMVIALNEVADQPFISRALILVVVAIGITVLVYGDRRPDREDGRRRPAAQPARLGGGAEDRRRTRPRRCRGCSR